MITINGFNQIKMSKYNIDIIDSYIIDYIIYAYSSDIVINTIIDDKKYMILNKDIIIKAIPILNLKERGIEKRINELIEKGFLDRKQKFIDKKKKSFIKPTSLCFFMKNDSYCNYDEFIKNEVDDLSKISKEEINNSKLEVKHFYKDCKHVKFTDEQLMTLKKEFPNDYEYQIMNVECYCEANGKSYSNYLQVIRNWNRKKQTQNNKKNKKNKNIILADEDF